MTFLQELEKLINKYSKENESNTPDFILADYIVGCLDTYNKTLNAREQWYGRMPKKSRCQPITEEYEVIENEKE